MGKEVCCVISVQNIVHNFSKDELRTFLFSWLKRLEDFQRTQPRKKRQNITKALRKIRNGEPMHKLEKEAIEKFIIYCVNHEEEGTK